jgi:hypothetical protein
VCEGYDKPTVFLNHFPKHFDQPDVPQDSLQQRHDCNYASGSWGLDRRAPDMVRLSHDGVVPDSNLVPGISNLQGLTCFVEAAQHDQALACFVTYCLPSSASEEVPLSWLASLARIRKETKVLHLAASTVTYGWIGHVDNKPDIIGDSLRLYSRTLEDLQEIIRQDGPTFGSEVLPTMQLLVLYEV